MKKKIKIKIKGIHESPEGEIEPVEVIALGQMFDKDGFLCITYEEAIDEGDDGVVSRVSGNLLKIRDDQVEIIREGPAKSHMVFVQGETTTTYYYTMYGEMEMGIHTENINKVLTQNGFDLSIRYTLEMNQTFISKCNVGISVEMNS